MTPTNPTTTLAHSPPSPQRFSQAGRARRRRPTATARRAHRPAAGRATIDRYTDWRGRVREIVIRDGCAGSVLVIDRDAATLTDRRLVAHLAADEPRENAGIASHCYLAQARRGRYRCRLLVPEDLKTIPFAVDLNDDPPRVHDAAMDRAIDVLARRFELARLQTRMSIPELRWRRRPSQHGVEDEPVSVREVIACLESYEPVRAVTRRALERHDRNSGVSTTGLRGELARVQDSPIVLNRRLREVVLVAAEREGLSMSEIAIRCGRIKRDAAGNESGETSWLSRRLGLLPEGGRETPTPWIHSDVLALIARDGLGISPREVELG
jgi:hypothetical protein